MDRPNALLRHKISQNLEKLTDTMNKLSEIPELEDIDYVFMASHVEMVTHLTEIMKNHAHNHTYFEIPE